MVAVNRVTLAGNVGRDAELRYLADGTAHARFSVAVSNVRRRDDGEWEELDPDWFEVSVWRDLAERVGNVAKGDSVYVEGRIHLNRWQRDDGTEGVALDVTADRVSVLVRREPRQDGAGGGYTQEPVSRGPSPAAQRPQQQQERPQLARPPHQQQRNQFRGKQRGGRR